MKKILGFLMIFLFVLSILSSCSIFDEDLNEIQKNEYIEEGFQYNYRREIKDIENEVPKEYRSLDIEENDDYDITYEEVDATSSNSDICSMGALDTILYPGALVDISNNVYTPINLDLAPLEMSVNLETSVGSNKSIVTTIDTPTLGNVRSGIQKIVTDNVDSKTNLPSNMTMEIREVKSKDEFYLNLGLGLQVKKFNIAEDFSCESVNKQTNIVIVIKQIYYTVGINHKGILSLIDENVSNKEINQAFYGKVPGYVSSVSYGRIVLLSIQTDYSLLDIKNTLNLGAFKIAELSSTLEVLSEDEETTIKYFQYGGGSSSVGNVYEYTSQQDFLNLFNSYDVNENTVSAPISYTISNYDGSLASLQSSSKYIIKNIKYNPKRIMSWKHLDEILKDKSYLKMKELKIDLTAMLNFDDLPNSNNIANRTITIPENIEKFEIIGPNDIIESIVYKNLSIYAFRRSDNPLEITLKHLQFNGTTRTENDQNINNISFAALNIEGAGKVTLIIEDKVLIEGNNSHGINAENLEIKGNGRLIVIGGEGRVGEKGYNALNIEDNLEVNFEGTIDLIGGKGGKGEDGLGYDREHNPLGDNLDGRHGESGREGNVGGSAIKASNLSVYTNGMLKLNLESGSGGEGGKGGDGEYAGYDKDPTAKAGNGGSGGNGGNGGLVFNIKSNCYISENVTEIKVKIGSGGNGGSGGSGGHSDEYGFIGKLKWSFPGYGASGGVGGSSGSVGINNNLLVIYECGKEGVRGSFGENGISDFYK